MFLGRFGTWPNLGCLVLWETWLSIYDFANFTAAHFVAKSRTVNSSQISHLWRLCLRQRYFSHYPRFMTIGEDWDKDRLIPTALRCLKAQVLWPRNGEDHALLYLLYQSGYQSCSASVTREYHFKVLQLLNLLRSTAAYLRRTLNWVSRETWCLGQFVPIFNQVWSHLAASRTHSCGRLCWEQAAPNRPQKANGWSFGRRTTATWTTVT